MMANSKPKHVSRNKREKLDHRLIEAAERGDTAKVRAMLAAGADVHAWGDDDALRSASSSGHTGMAQVLLASGADVQAKDGWALRWAANGGHTETVKVLLAAGADVHAKDDWPLRAAVYNGHTETVQVLERCIFAPDVWRGKSRAEIEAAANALYDAIKADNPRPDRLRTAGTILLDCALTCWEQVRPPPPPGFKISPLPAQPRPL